MRADMAPVWTTITAIRTKNIDLSNNSAYWRLGIFRRYVELGAADR
jgi:hypothetical protein